MVAVPEYERGDASVFVSTRGIAAEALPGAAIEPPLQDTADRTQVFPSEVQLSGHPFADVTLGILTRFASCDVWLTAITG